MASGRGAAGGRLAAVAQPRGGVLGSGKSSGGRWPQSSGDTGPDCSPAGGMSARDRLGRFGPAQAKAGPAAGRGDRGFYAHSLGWTRSLGVAPAGTGEDLEEEHPSHGVGPIDLPPAARLGTQGGGHAAAGHRGAARVLSLPPGTQVSFISRSFPAAQHHQYRSARARLC